MKFIPLCFIVVAFLSAARADSIWISTNASGSNVTNAIETSDATFFNRFGQLIYQEPLGRAAGYEHPQFSIHRGDLQMVLLDAFRARAGSDRPDSLASRRGVPSGRGRATQRDESRRTNDGRTGTRFIAAPHDSHLSSIRSMYGR